MTASVPALMCHEGLLKPARCDGGEHDGRGGEKGEFYALGGVF